jgi:MFS superfamily sulfate permease-like transporter
MAFKGLLLNGIAEAKKLWTIDIKEWLLWMVALLVTLFWEIVPALGFSVLMNVIFLFYHITRPGYGTLGRIPDNERVYRPTSIFKLAKPVDGVVIFYWAAPLHFANKDVFVKAVVEEVDKIPEVTEGHEVPIPVHAVVIDAGPITRVDITAAREVHKMVIDLADRKVKVLLCNCSFQAHHILDNVGLFQNPKKKESEVICFRDLHDAVLFAEGEIHFERGSWISSNDGQSFNERMQMIETTSHPVSASSTSESPPQGADDESGR